MNKQVVWKIGSAVLAVLILVTGGLGAWRVGSRYLEQRREQERIRTCLERNFKELQERRITVQNQRDYLAVERQQIATRQEQVAREIKKMKELLATLGQEPK